MSKTNMPSKDLAQLTLAGCSNLQNSELKSRTSKVVECRSVKRGVVTGIALGRGNVRGGFIQDGGHVVD
jgi:predicted sugar kinase